MAKYNKGTDPHAYTIGAANECHPTGTAIDLMQKDHTQALFCSRTLKLPIQQLTVVFQYYPGFKESLLTCINQPLSELASSRSPTILCHCISSQELLHHHPWETLEILNRLKIDLPNPGLLACASQHAAYGPACKKGTWKSKA